MSEEECSEVVIQSYNHMEWHAPEALKCSL